MLKQLELKTTRRIEFVDITGKVKQIVKQSGVSSGLCTIFVPHTTAAVTINENADVAVQNDINDSLSHLLPHRGNYLHKEGNADAHIKSSLTGCSLNVIIDKGQLLLGQWQGIFFCEYDGPRARTVHIKIIKDTV